MGSIALSPLRSMVMTWIVAVPVTPEKVLVAVRVKDPTAVAVNRPPDVVVPPPFVDQVTALLAAWEGPVTVAVNVSDPPTGKVGVGGVTDTLTEAGETNVAVAVPGVLVGEAVLVAVTV